METKMEVREHKLFDWMVIQSLHKELGILDADKVAQLEVIVPNWFAKYSKEFPHALNCDNVELQQAFETWWNTEGLSEFPMTYPEIQLKAALEEPSN
jgi:hypothetical protein